MLFIRLPDTNNRRIPLDSLAGYWEDPNNANQVIIEYVVGGRTFETVVPFTVAQVDTALTNNGNTILNNS